MPPLARRGTADTLHAYLMSVPSSDLLGTVLTGVSRSFSLTLRLLPNPVRPQIGIAYLLARATDTIADTDAVPPQTRMETLRLLRDRILGNHDQPLDFRELAASQALPAERELLSRIDEAIQFLSQLSCFDRCCIREVVSTITSGQELDLQRFHAASGHHLTALRSNAELDDYTFRVAGCVGGFWTRLCRSHLYPQAPLDLAHYLEDAVRFGKGLQLVNILRDLPSDLRLGRCYLPEDGLARAGLQPRDLLDPAAVDRFKPVYLEYLEMAADHLRAGWRYTCTTPRNQRRVRIACALPLLIGAQTLQRLAHSNVLDPTRRIKISRNAVRGILVRTVLLHPFPRRWEQLFRLRLDSPTHRPAP